MNPGNEHQDLYELYVLGLLEEPERSLVEEELRRNDPVAKARLRRALELNALLGMNVEVAEPRKDLRRRITSLAGPLPTRAPWSLAWAALSACLVGGLIYTGMQRQAVQDELAVAQSALDKSQAALAVREATLEFLRQPETRILKSGSAATPQPVAKVFVNQSRGVLLVASNLPALPAGRTYEMWVVPKSGGPRPAGLFRPQTDGGAIHWRPGPVSLDDAAAIALSDEPEGGSPQPTTQPFLITPVAE